MDTSVFNLIVFGWIGIALALIPLQLKVTAPYGRHASAKWGPTLPYRTGWILMELVSPLVFGWFFLTGATPKNEVSWLIFILWTGHYLNRSLIYPFRAKMEGRRIPLVVVFSAVFFNSMNGWLNGYFLGTLSPPYPSGWMFSLPFAAGMFLFLSGMAINIRSDNYLLSLRKPGESGYKIPKGRWFSLVSCPNHLGEILEWTGFALICWNLPAFSFAVWTAANLIPRAISHHKWYRARFDDYPAGRKAVIPLVL